MINNLVVIGKLIDDPEEHDTYTYLELLNRNKYKNENGEYTYDKIPVYLFGKLKDKVKKDDLIAVRGRLKELKGLLVVEAHEISLLNERGK